VTKAWHQYIGISLLALAAGCASTRPTAVTGEAGNPNFPLLMCPGDEIEVRFFGADEMSTVQTIRRDGKISLQLIGEVQAAWQTPIELQNEITKLVGSQLQVKAVVVVLKTAPPVYDGGAVMKPGRVPLAAPMTVLQAVMEAGGFDPDRADPSGVVVVRYDGLRCQTWRFDFDGVLQGKAEVKDRSFYVRPFDVIYVPRGLLR
jgi:polysaccharide biosynthesis/export protein